MRAGCACWCSPMLRPTTSCSLAHSSSSRQFAPSPQLRTRRFVSLARVSVLGSLPDFDVERARTDAQSARAAIPPLETLADTSRHRIAVLIGSQAADAAMIKPWAGSATVPDIAPGQPAALLERRPDLLASRAQLEAANFRRRQAAAEWFPRLFLGALFGSQSADMNGIDLGVTRFSNASSLLTMPIFDWGRTRSINEIAASGQNEALLRYEDAIVRALEDVENALVALRDQRIRTEALQSAAASADAALGHAQSLYDRGQIDLLPLLDAQRTRLSVRVSANNSNTQLLLAAVDLFKALGGGWQAFEPGAAPKTANCGPPISFRNPDEHQRGSVVNASIGKAAIAATIASLLSACSPDAPPAELLRPVRTSLTSIRDCARNKPLLRFRAGTV